MSLVRALRRLDNLRDAYYEAESRAVDLTETNDALLAENCRLRGELARACSERDEARATSTWREGRP
jgi:hypothetical protein